ncbi:hypothetical protein [Candidatus Pantoea carbekii]|uniref:hypothetical protein n=1 Tax=Candidatus Pantoea carbekii TaxID=1235990 RepID=UPI000B33C0F6|nr:hypothetical protein [Candidatus Pantoea carbekii]
MSSLKEEIMLRKAKNIFKLSALQLQISKGFIELSMKNIKSIQSISLWFKNKNY